MVAALATADFNPQNHETSAVDVNGVRHDGRSYKGAPPWNLDRLSGIAPYYPVEDRRYHHQGRGIVRMTIDLSTGRVVKVVMVKSTGYRSLGDCAIAAFKTWTWRPGRWKEIEFPVRFEIGDYPAAPPSGFIRLPPH